MADKKKKVKKIDPALDKGIKFAARKEPAYLFFFLAITAAVVYIAVYATETQTLVRVLAAVIICMFLKIIFFSFYVFQEKGLRVTIGIRMPVIEYNQITEVSRAKKLLTASTVSFQCLRIRYGKSKFAAVYVAPENEEEFLKILRKQCASAKFLV